MVDMDEIFEPGGADGADPFGVPALLLAPAVLRIVISGKDIDTELDALVTAVAILQGPDGFMRSFIHEVVVTQAQKIEQSGIKGLAEAAKRGLGPDEAAMAFQIALVAVFSSPLGKEDDIGVLSAIAERIGFSEDDFAEVYERARRAVAQP